MTYMYLCVQGVLACEYEYVHVSVHECINVGNAHAPTYTCGCFMLLGIVLRLYLMGATITSSRSLPILS